ncbi:hypothetical protein [Massilia sp. erpn]|uniref:hypothetical protein n=1 Tax=Massilia sp. erpn TaxID=2738142 RepID=UPI002103A550|nr:hypothetical protein [Massilia sp. erpn]UTY56997.1 hypothetical protein HPQ68_07215 [Massilia sp. erpn]
MKLGRCLCWLALACCAPLQAQQSPDAATVQVVEISGLSDPDERRYRDLVKGMDFFEQYHHLAPQGTLRYRILPRLPKVAAQGTVLTLRGNGGGAVLPLAPDMSFTVERDSKLYEDNAVVSSNRKDRSFAWMPEVRTPGLPAHMRRLGDLRLECEVNRGADLAQGLKTPSWYALNATSDLCVHRKQGWWLYADRPVFSATLVHGARRQVLFSSHYYGRPLPPMIFSFYDFYPLLMDRTVWVHISDASWPDDTLIELEYMDEAPLASAAH